MSEPPLTPPATRAKLAELMFENFSAPAYFSCISGVLGLFSTGYTTGMVVDAGEGATHTLPVYEGYASIHAINRLDVSGEFLTFHLRDMLADRGYSFTTPMEIDIVRNIKEQECYIAEDFEHETKLAEEQDASNKFYELPDGNTILIGYERFRCPEALFEPQFLGIEDDGLHHKLYQSVMKSDQEIRRELYSNIILLGGSTLFPGLKERLYATVKNLAPVGTVPEVKDPPERLYSVWIGGSVLASLSTFSKMSIERHEYYEKGPDRDLFVQRKFFC